VQLELRSVGHRAIIRFKRNRQIPVAIVGPSADANPGVLPDLPDMGGYLRDKRMFCAKAGGQQQDREFSQK
jgi:hypothetical protein